MSSVLEVSEGYPVDSKPFEPPQQSRDLEQPHYVTILGSMVEPDTALERPWTKGGGIEITNPCLRYVKNFIRKGRITPVLKDTYNWMAADMWEKATGKDSSYFPRPIPPGYTPPLNENGFPTKIPPMMGRMAYPGQQIDSIVNGNANIFKRSRRGVVEHKSLQGQPYNPEPLGNGIVTDRQMWRIQTTIFPTYPVLPILLDDLERLLNDASIHTSLRTIVDDMYLSLTQFREYAKITVEQTHYTMRENAQKSESGYIPRYTGLDFVLLEQLGMARQDMNIRKETATSDPELRDALKQLIALQAEEKQANLDRLKRLEEIPPIDAHTMAAAPITEGYPGYPGQSGYSGFSGEVLEAEQIKQPETEVYACTACGKPFDTVQGLSMHRTRWCEKLINGEAQGE